MPGFSFIQRELRERSHEAFESIVADLLSGLLPRFVKSDRLGALDCLGIDVHQYDEDTNAVTLAVQCKGLQVAFDATHLKSCLAEIAKYRRIGPVVPEYWLVINKPVRSEMRATLEVALKTLVDQGKAQKALLFDLSGMVAHLRALASQQLATWADRARTALKTDYAERLEVVRYIGEAPYTLSVGGLAESHQGRGPAAWVTDTIRAYLAQIHADHVGKDRAPPRYLVTASFGFGKTSTLHAVADRWLGDGGHVIYAPAALLPAGAFLNGALLTDALVDLIAPSDLDAIDLTKRILRETLRKELARSKNWLLLVDGLDESPYWGDHDRLSALWGGIVDLGLPLIASVRDELFQLRRQEFEAGDGRSFGRPFFTLLALKDWGDDLIGEFLDRFEARMQSSAPKQFVRFRQLVEDGDYTKTYGDIPKRPLFLGMLVEDAWRDLEPERELHRLYDKYLRRKLHGDRFSAGAGGRVVRVGGLAKDLGQDEATERMMLAMQSIAGQLLMRSTSGENAFSALIDEKELHNQIEFVTGSKTLTEDISLNSLLQPAGRDEVTNRRLFRFAHQSFQDWFAARWLVQEERDWSSPRYPAAVSAFAERMAEDRKMAAGAS